MDVACGSGQLTFDLSRYFKRVVGVEPSEKQRKEIGDPKERKHPSCEEVTILEGTAEAIPLPSEFADNISVAQAIHWINEGKFFEEGRRVLKKSGTVSVVGYGTPFISDLEPLNEVWKRCYFEEIKPHFPINQHTKKSIRDPVDDHYANITLPFEDTQRKTSEISQEMNVTQFFNYLGFLIFLQSFIFHSYFFHNKKKKTQCLL